MPSYDRYSKFRNDGKIEIVPFAKIRKRNTDFYEVYRKNRTRLDTLSYQYYKDSSYGWLILQANPEVGSMEYEIEDKTTLRIPYPLSDAIQDYEEGIDEYYRLNGHE